MSKPLVAIVGRPNVGKSTIINGLAQKRVSIVEDIPGVTRDRIYCDVRWLDREFTMIDTGGIELAMSVLLWLMKWELLVTLWIPYGNTKGRLSFL